jgi:hypothetical protein
MENVVQGKRAREEVTLMGYGMRIMEAVALHVESPVFNSTNSLMNTFGPPALIPLTRCMSTQACLDCEIYSRFRHSQSRSFAHKIQCFQREGLGDKVD